MQCKSLTEITINIFETVQFQKISTLPPGNSSLFSYIASKHLVSKMPLPLGTSNDLPWGGYGFFLELHIVWCGTPLTPHMHVGSHRLATAPTPTLLHRIVDPPPWVPQVKVCSDQKLGACANSLVTLDIY